MRQYKHICLCWVNITKEMQRMRKTLERERESLKWKQKNQMKYKFDVDVTKNPIRNDLIALNYAISE